MKIKLFHIAGISLIVCAGLAALYGLIVESRPHLEELQYSTRTDEPTSTPTPPTVAPTAAPTRTPTRTAVATSIVITVTVKSNIQFRGGAGIFAGASDETTHLKTIPRGQSAIVLGRNGQANKPRARWLFVEFEGTRGFAWFPLFEWTLGDEVYIALPIIDPNTDLPVPSLTPETTPTPSLAATLTPRPTSSRTPSPTRTSLPTFVPPDDDSYAVINKRHTDCVDPQGIPFVDGEQVHVHGRAPNRPQLYVGIWEDPPTYAFVDLTCLIWTGNIEKKAEVVFPTPTSTSP